jgi:hypothetical protein
MPKRVVGLHVSYTFLPMPKRVVGLHVSPYASTRFFRMCVNRVVGPWALGLWLAQSPRFTPTAPHGTAAYGDDLPRRLLQVLGKLTIKKLDWEIHKSLDILNMFQGNHKYEKHCNKYSVAYRCVF